MIVVVDVVLVAELGVLDVKVKIRQLLLRQAVDLQIVVVGVKIIVVISVRMGVLHATRVASEDVVHVVMCVVHHVALDAQMGARLHLLYQKIITHVPAILVQVTAHWNVQMYAKPIAKHRVNHVDPYVKDLCQQQFACLLVQHILLHLIQVHLAVYPVKLMVKFRAFGL